MDVLFPQRHAPSLFNQGHIELEASEASEKTTETQEETKTKQEETDTKEAHETKLKEITETNSDVETKDSRIPNQVDRLEKKRKHTQKNQSEVKRPKRVAQKRQKSDIPSQESNKRKKTAEPTYHFDTVEAMLKAACCGITKKSDMQLLEWSESVLLGFLDKSYLKQSTPISWTRALELAQDNVWAPHFNDLWRDFQKVFTIKDILEQNRIEKLKHSLVTGDEMFCTNPIINKKLLLKYKPTNTKKSN